MQIIIDMDERDYADIMSDSPRNLNYYERMIKRGTPIPKGHGRLIDANDLLDRIGLEDNDRNRADNVGEIITLEDFDFTPAIIEADEESEGQHYV